VDIYEHASRLGVAEARIRELEAAIRAILAINERFTLCDDVQPNLNLALQSMELSKALDTAECLVGWGNEGS